MIIRKEYLAILATAAFLSLTFIDETGVAVTLPLMARELGLSRVATEWVMNGFFLSLAVSVMVAGRASDIFGHKKAFVIGLAIFFASSILVAISNSAIFIVLSRALQGVGASFMLATYAVLLGRIFPVEKQGLALGTSAAFASFFLATGPLIGGFFTEVLSWRLLFGLNVPICLMIWLIIRSCIPQDNAPSLPSARLDWLGASIFVIAFGALMLGLTWLGEKRLYDPGVLLCLAITIIGAMAFVAVERRVHQPLVEFELFKNRTFLSANIVLMTSQVCALVITFWALWLALAMHMSPRLAGLALLPAGIPILIAARLGGRWADKSGTRPPILMGTLLCTVSMAWMAFALPSMSYRLAFIGMLFYAIGAPLAISPAIKAVLMSVPVEKGGIASGILNTMRNLGAALCLALVGGTIDFLLARRANHAVVGGAAVEKGSEIFERLLTSGDSTDAYSPSILLMRSIYAHASGDGMWVAFSLSLVGFMFAFFGLPNKDKYEELSELSGGRKL